MSDDIKFCDFNPENTIVINTPKLIEFKRALKRQYEIVNKRKSYPEDLEEMKIIIKEIELLKLYFENEMRKKDSKRYKRVINDLDYLYEKYLQGYSWGYLFNTFSIT